MYSKFTFSLCILLFSFTVSNAQFGRIDSTFGTNGIVKTVVGATGQTICRNLLALPNGKILATGYSNTGSSNVFTVIRYLTNGSVDTVFGKKGIATLAVAGSPSSFGYCSVLEPGGKILVGGDYYNGTSYNFAVGRFNADGSVDTTFGNKGAATFSVGTSATIDNVGQAIELQSDGKIILAGTSFNNGTTDFTVVRFNSNGTVDSTFGNKGAVITPIGAGNDNCYSMTVQADDKIILGGDINQGTAYVFTAVRYLKNGAIDLSFANAGIFIDSIGVNDDDYGYAIEMQADQKILFGGTARTANGYDFALMRLNTNGALDNTFGKSGKVFTDFKGGVNGGSIDYGKCIAIQPDGKIVMGGRTFLNGSEFGVARYLSNGAPDLSFSDSGMVVCKAGNAQHYGNGIVIDSYGRIVLGGNATEALPDYFVLVRFTSGLSVGVRSMLSSELESVKIFPVPANTSFEIQGKDAIESISVSDISGKVIWGKTNLAQGDIFPVSNLSNGIYWIRLTTRKETITKKLVVNH